MNNTYEVTINENGVQKIFLVYKWEQVVSLCTGQCEISVRVVSRETLKRDTKEDDSI